MAKIMLVEDDNNLREIYEARLQAEGYEIVAAKDGEEALVLAKNEKPELIISDVMMPKISGFEMLDILRNTDGLKDVKIIMLTALGQSDDQQRADRLGADRYLVKSQVTLEDIVKVAHDLLEKDSLALAMMDPSIDQPLAAAVATPVAAPATPPAPASPPPVPVEPPVAAASPPSSDPAPVETLVPAVPTVPAPAPNDLPEPTAASPVAPTPAPAQPAETPYADTSSPTSSAQPATTNAVVPPIAPLDDSANLSDSLVQSTAEEEATVEAEIEDFVAGASSTPIEPAAPPTIASPAIPTPSAPSAPAADSTTEPLSAADSASNDKLMADAVDSLIASTDNAPETPTETPPTLPPASPNPPSPPSESSEAATTPPIVTSPSTAQDGTQTDIDTVAVPTTTGSVPIAHKKIINPLDSSTEPKQDIHALLAAEEAKEAVQAAASAALATPQPLETSNQSVADSSSPAPEVTTTPATAPPPSVQPSVNGPQSSPSGFDPNSIAL